MALKSEVLAQLQKDVFSLQGFKPVCTSAMKDIGLGCINLSFHKAVFPLAAVHEFFCTNAEEGAASSAFIAGILSSFICKDSKLIWISSSRAIFPPALKSFGMDPDQIFFVDLKKEKEVLWAVEEALKCNSLSAVISEMSEISFTASRRFQLVIEKTGVPCFVLRRNPRNLTTACVTRWHLKSLPCSTAENFPGVGFPRWQVELLKVRNGKPGVWDLEWAEGCFRHLSKIVVINKELQKKFG
ncbi:MAG: Error-prone repair protein ImuA [Bacteroidota bacterium]|nr:Error-prone repair protein ImuA [Bacteroidota bacterium]